MNPVDRPTDHLLLSGLLGVGVGLCLYFLRAPVPRAVAVGLTSGVSVFLLIWLLNWRARGWSTRPPVTASARSRAPRWEIPHYQRMFERPPGYSEQLRSRLRSIVDRRFERLGVAFDSDLGRDLLGPGPHQLLRAVPDKPPGGPQLTELARAIHAILPDDASGPPSRVGGPVDASPPKGLPTV